jgi:hypothetical protein
VIPSQQTVILMRKRSSWRLRLIAGALLVVGVALAWNLVGGPIAALSTWLFPQEVELFVIDSRSNGDFASDLERAYPRADQRRDGVRVTVRKIALEQMLRTSAQLLDKFEQTRNAGESNKLFVGLVAPYSCSKKALRKEVDEQTRFTGEGRVALLGPTVAIVGTRVGEVSDPCSKEPDACARLRDDWAYSRWTFGGLGLAVDEHTMGLVGNCLPQAIMDSKSPTSSTGG